ncbi:MAG: zinc ribbon domain-containing protein [Methanobrevibacter sp.]|nr:zinc ribbon domain-containing protein [Methanobrevibacter sp.]
MKTCPNCGSILADNEPYCENCGFDPDFDMGGWNHGKTRVKPYYHGDHIKDQDNYVLGKEVDWAIFAVAMGFLIFTICIFVF